MKICLFGITGIPTGNHNLKDARLDQADKLVEAQKKSYAQVVLADEKEMAVCDAILTSRAALSDLLMKDLDFVETRLGRDAGEAEKKVLQKMAEGLVSETPVAKLGLTAEELAADFGARLCHQPPGGGGRGGGIGGAGGPAGAGVRGERLHLFPDRRRQGEPRLAHPRRHDGLGGGGHRPHRHAEGVHPGGDHQLCRIWWRRAGRRRPSAPAKSGWN